MSEGNAPSASFAEQQRPTEHDINLLIDIVRKTEAATNAGENLHHALISAYETTFQERGLDVRDDRACLWVVLKLINPRDHEGSLFERFERIMHEQRIVLTFDDELSSSSVIDTHRASDTSAAGAHLDQGPSPERGPPTAESHQSDEWMDRQPPYFNEMMRKAEEIERRNALAYCRGLLRPLRDVQALLTVGDRHYERKLQFKAISHWSHLTAECQNGYLLAEQHDGHRLRACAVTKFRDQARIQQISAMDEQRLKGRGLYLMTLATREQWLRRKAHATLKHRYLTQLLTTARQLRSQQVAIDVKAAEFQATSDMRARRPAWQALNRFRERVNTMNAQADAHLDVKHKIRQMGTWYHRTQSIAHMGSNADDFHDFSLLRKGLNQMRVVNAERHDRRMVLGRWILTQWRKYVKHRKQTKYETGYYQMRRKVKMNSARKFLRLIAGRAEQVHSLDERAMQWSDHRVQRLAHGAVIKIYNITAHVEELGQLADRHVDQQRTRRVVDVITAKTEQVRQMHEKAEQFHEIQTRGASSRRLHHLSMKLFEVQQERQKADAYRARRNRDLIRTDLKKLRVAVADRRGEAPLVLPPVTPSQRRAEQMSRLTSTTPIYTPAPPLLSFTARLRGETTERVLEELDEEDGR